MSGDCHFDLLCRGPHAMVSLVNRRPVHLKEEIERLAREWDCIADRVDCHTLLVDCSKVELMSSAMLSKLIVLQRRLKQKEIRLTLFGLRPEVREVLRWTKLDRFFDPEGSRHAGR